MYWIEEIHKTIKGSSGPTYRYVNPYAAKVRTRYAHYGGYRENSGGLYWTPMRRNIERSSVLAFFAQPFPYRQNKRSPLLDKSMETCLYRYKKDASLSP